MPRGIWWHGTASLIFRMHFSLFVLYADFESKVVNLISRFRYNNNRD